MGISSSQLTFLFFRGVQTTNQMRFVQTWGIYGGFLRDKHKQIIHFERWDEFHDKLTIQRTERGSQKWRAGKPLIWLTLNLDAIYNYPLQLGLGPSQANRFGWFQILITCLLTGKPSCYWITARLFCLKFRSFPLSQNSWWIPTTSELLLGPTLKFQLGGSSQLLVGKVYQPLNGGFLK